MKGFSNSKRLNVIFILLMLVCNMAVAQSRYKVYKCNGDVAIKKFRSGSWETLSRNEDIALVDLVKIGEGSSFAILDARTKRIYKCTLKGEKLVKYHIEEAVRAADKVTANLNGEILSQLKEQNEAGKGHSRIAAAYRGNNDSAGFTDSLALFIRKKCAAIQEERACAVFASKQLSSDSFVLNKITAGDDEYWLSLENNSNDDVFANVVRISDNGSCSLCYEFGYASDAECIIIPANSKMELPQYLFANSANEKHLLVVTEKPYDTHALQLMLSDKY